MLELRSDNFIEDYYQFWTECCCFQSKWQETNSFTGISGKQISNLKNRTEIEVTRAKNKIHQPSTLYSQTTKFGGATDMQGKVLTTTFLVQFLKKFYQARTRFSIYASRKTVVRVSHDVFQKSEKKGKNQKVGQPRRPRPRRGSVQGVTLGSSKGGRGSRPWR